MGTYLDKNGGAAVFEGVKPYMEGAHLAFINLEGAISDKGARNSIKEYTFRLTSSPARRADSRPASTWSAWATITSSITAPKPSRLYLEIGRRRHQARRSRSRTWRRPRPPR